MNCCNNLQHSREHRSRRGILDSGASILPVPKGATMHRAKTAECLLQRVGHDVLEEG